MRLGFGEVLVVLALALLFFGPSKLPQLGSSLGQALKSFKKGLSSLQEDVEAEPQQERKSLPAEQTTADTASREQVEASKKVS